MSADEDFDNVNGIEELSFREDDTVAGGASVVLFAEVEMDRGFVFVLDGIELVPIGIVIGEADAAGADVVRIRGDITLGDVAE